MIDFNNITVEKANEYNNLLTRLQPQLEDFLPNWEEADALTIYSVCPGYIEEIVSFWMDWDARKQKDFCLVIGVFVWIRDSEELKNALQRHYKA